ncbi:MAG: L-dopachrome tautomerase-related protein [Bacteriovoracia bacterium]
MKIVLAALAATLLTSCSTGKKDKQKNYQEIAGRGPTNSRLQEIASFKGVQVTGVTASEEGRLFASFPRWREGVPFSVVEIFAGGVTKPYPNAEWNAWNGTPDPNKFTSVQSVYAHKNHLYVLDPASPEMKGVIGNARLFRFDLSTNQLDRAWYFDQKIAPTNSYLNDVRIDEEEKKIFITDSGIGGIVVIDENSGETRRLLDKHPSTKAEDVTLVVDQEKFDRRVHADGLAISPIDDMLYYQALTGRTLYRVPTDVLKTDIKHETQIVKNVENLGTTPATDGMVFDNRGNLYMADLEKSSITYRTPEGEIKTLVKDNRLEWPDTFTVDERMNELIFTDSHLQSAEVGKSVEDITFTIYRVSLPAKSL